MIAASRIAGEDRIGPVALAPLRAEHARALQPLLDDWAVARMLAEVPWPLPRDAVAELAARARAERGCDEFAILAGGSPVGIGSVRHPGSGAPPRLMPRLGFWIGRAFWGRGIATAAVAKLADHAFSRSSGERIGAGVFVDNPASRRVLEKLGFERVGGYPTPCRSRRTEVDVDDMHLTRTAWPEGAGR